MDPKLRTGLIAAVIVGGLAICGGIPVVLLLMGRYLPPNTSPKTSSVAIPKDTKQQSAPPSGGTYLGFDSSTYLEMFDDLDAETHVQGVVGLRIIGDRIAIQGLIKRLKTKGEDWRADAAKTLGDIGPTAHEALPTLREMAERDPSSLVQRMARNAIPRIDK